MLRALDLTIRRRIDSLVPGEHRAPALGHGTELAQVRPYQLGDDVRQIDWNVTARMREPHVRVHVAGAGADDLAAARHLGLDELRHRRPPQGRRGRGRGARDRPRRDAARQPARRDDLRRRASRTLMPPRQGRSGLLGLLLALRDEPAPEGARRDALGEALSARRRGSRASAAWS